MWGYVELGFWSFVTLYHGRIQKNQGMGFEFFCMVWDFFLKNPSKLKKIFQKGGFDLQNPSLNTPLDR